MHQPVILLGAGGHAKVVLDLLRRMGVEVIGVCDPALANAEAQLWRDLKVLGDDNAVLQYPAGEITLANGIGNLPGQTLRRSIFERFRHDGYHFAPLIHPQAILAEGVEIDEGAQIMAGAILQVDCKVGMNSIINTGARIDHDCNIGSHCHIAPATTLSGHCTIGDGSHLGTGCNVIQNIRIGSASVIGAGTTVLRDVPAQSKLLGCKPGSAQPIGGSSTQ